MMKFHPSLPILVLTIGFLEFLSAAAELSSSLEDQSPSANKDTDFERLFYDPSYELGKRAYRYSSQFKRLPMYDFGLGKRAKVYGFGLGKRSDELYDYYDQHNDGDYEDTVLYDDHEMQTIGKRDRQYAFGLGKRPRYDFGLGKRLRNFNFGLGKRERMYGFGLGKRASKMYSFGLGKRSEEDGQLVKREVVEDRENDTVEPESHEIMGHPRDASHAVDKRSPRQYAFGLGKRDDGTLDDGEDVDEELVAFPRYYRRPASYNFGLGKRRVFNFGLVKGSLKK